MELTVNGATRQIPDGTTIIALLLEHSRSTEGVAVAVDGEIVHRAQWQQCVLADGQTVELITALQGG
jgi:sulfur carrier protein